MQNLADTLAETLNYKYSMEAPEDGEWGVKIHDNWTGQIGMLYNNVSCLHLGVQEKLIKNSLFFLENNFAYNSFLLRTLFI